MVLEFVKYIILLCSKYHIYIHVYTEEQIDHEEDNATFTVGICIKWSDLIILIISIF